MRYGLSLDCHGSSDKGRPVEGQGRWQGANEAVKWHEEMASEAVTWQGRMDWFSEGAVVAIESSPPFPVWVSWNRSMQIFASDFALFSGPSRHLGLEEIYLLCDYHLQEAVIAILASLHSGEGGRKAVKYAYKDTKVQTYASYSDVNSIEFSLDLSQVSMYSIAAQVTLNH